MPTTLESFHVANSKIPSINHTSLNGQMSVSISSQNSSYERFAMATGSTIHRAQDQWCYDGDDLILIGLLHHIHVFSDGGVRLYHCLLVRDHSRIDHGLVMFIKQFLPQCSILYHTLTQVDNQSLHTLLATSIENVSRHSPDVAFELLTVLVSDQTLDHVFCVDHIFSTLHSFLYLSRF